MEESVKAVVRIYGVDLYYLHTVGYKIAADLTEVTPLQRMVLAQLPEAVAKVRGRNRGRKSRSRRRGT